MGGIKKRQKVKNVFQSFIVQTIRNINLSNLFYEKYGCHACSPHRPINTNHLNFTTTNHHADQQIYLEQYIYIYIYICNIYM